MTDQQTPGTEVVLPSLNSNVALFVTIERVADFSWPLPLYMARLTFRGKAPKYEWRTDTQVLVFASDSGRRIAVSQLFLPQSKLKDLPKLVSLSSHRVIEMLDTHEVYTRRQKGHLIEELRNVIEVEINKNYRRPS